MVFDLTFEEAVDILVNRIGWVQGENFNHDEYMALDRTEGIFIRNTVDGFRLVHDSCGKQTREIWTDVSFMQDEIKNQKYRFILVLNGDSVKGVGAYSRGNDRNSYLTYKALNKNRR